MPTRFRLRHSFLEIGSSIRCFSFQKAAVRKQRVIVGKQKHKEGIRGAMGEQTGEGHGKAMGREETMSTRREGRNKR